MGDKSLQKRKYIVEKARDVFCKNGYRAVTMKDIVEACGISRGGLYLYFDSVKSLFEAVVEGEYADAPSALDSRGDGSTPGEILLMYLDEQKKAILKKKDSLAAALYEYLFENRPSENDSPVISLLNKNTELLERLISDGVRQEWMVCDDAAEAARNISYTIEGMKLTSQTAGITAEQVDREIEYIMGTLGMVVK